MADAAGLAVGITASLSELSREFGVSRETVGKRLLNAGVVSLNKVGGHPVYPLGDSARAILELTARGFIEINPDKLPPKERLDHFKAGREELALKRDMGLVVDADDARNEMAKLIKGVTRMLESLGDVLERDEGISPEVFKRINDEISDARSSMADVMEQ